MQTTDVYVCHANPKFLLALCKYLFLFKQFLNFLIENGWRVLLNVVVVINVFNALMHRIAMIMDDAFHTHLIVRRG